jgi:hypothetical protein
LLLYKRNNNEWRFEMKETFRRIGMMMAIAFVAMVAVGAAREVSFDVPLCEPVYRYLDMLPLPGRVSGISLSSRPFTEAQVCSLLVYAERMDLCSDTGVHHFYLRRFSRTDSGNVLSTIPMRGKFDGWRTYAYPYFYSSFNVQDSNYSDLGFSAFGIDSISQRSEFYNRSGIGVRLYSAMDNFLVFFDGTIVTEYSSLRKWVKIDDPLGGQNHAAIFGDTSHLMGYDDFSAYIKFPLPWCDVKLGNDRVSWGHADSSGLLFSGRGKPFLQAKFDKTIGALDYSFLIGKLIGDTYRQKRVVYAKHIVYTPRQWLSLGFSDIIISGNSEIQPLYFMPFLPFYFSQHFIGSSDNMEISLDGKLMVGKKWAAYGEFIMDDISNLLGVFRNTSWGDKWGGLFGIKIFNPLPDAYTSVFKAEIMQVEPWVYTTSSASQADNPNYPVHFGNLLGNAFGPHSRALTFDLTCQLSKKIGVEVTVQQIWKGSGPGSIVSDFFDSVIDTASDTARYESKSYRFEKFDRNRTIVSLRVFTFLNDWLRLNCYGSFVGERRPRAVSLFRAGADVQINY